jgi:hypothetical protein
VARALSHRFRWERRLLILANLAIYSWHLRRLAKANFGFGTLAQRRTSENSPSKVAASETRGRISKSAGALVRSLLDRAEGNFSRNCGSALACPVTAGR